MDLDLVQHGLVTLVALGAAGLVGRRLMGAARPAPGAAPGCANCPSGGGACHPATTAQTTSAPAEHPLVFVRPPPH